MTASNSNFSSAATAVVDGDLDALRALLSANPELVHARSGPPHHASLLHYVAANGVEDELQRTPLNAVEVCELLLEAGAEPDANPATEGNTGAENQTPLCLLVSSSHPHERGLQCELVRALVAGGAKVNGVLDDGAPLATALVFGYTRAAETLAELGARVDNLFFAAGLGDLDTVRGHFDAAGELHESATSGYRSPFSQQGSSSSTKREPAASDQEALHLVQEAPHLVQEALLNLVQEALLHLVQEALHFAVTHGRLEVAEFLLARGADVNGRVQGHHCELPLMQALFVGELAAARALLSAGADPDLTDGMRETCAREVLRASGLEAILDE